MNQIPYHSLLALSACASLPAAAQQTLPDSPDRQPNIVVIYADDMGYANGTQDWNGLLTPGMMFFGCR